MTENLPDTNVGNIEYIRRQDVVEECGEWYVEEGTEEGFIGTVSQMLDMFLPADVVPVVRCKDCKYWNNGNVVIGCYWDIDGGQPEGIDFCSRGKRKE